MRPMASAEHVRPSPSPALAAATVILVRSVPTVEPAGFEFVPPIFEVLFLRRHSSLAFMGGAHVFAGGKRDPVDWDDTFQSLVPRHVCLRAAGALDATPGRTLDDTEAVGLHLAACRELFEEARILLVDPTPSPEIVAGVARQLRRSASDAAFYEALAAHSLRPAIEDLHYVAHWLTPSSEPRRFDTRYFLAALPRGQLAALDPRESSSLEWMTPSSALDRHTRGDIMLPPPTLRTMEALNGLVAIGGLSFLSELDQPWPRIRAVLPKLVGEGNSRRTLLPWDREYAATGGDGWAFEREEASLFIRGPSRIVFEAGTWVSREG
jgi:8-oxo-dGTP pyrophosphatase MutT (NUDIX family)